MRPKHPIPAHAEQTLRESDERRKRVKPFDGQAFARSIEADIKLALEGKSADVVETPEGPIVTKRLADKYPVRSRWLKFCVWQSRTFRNGFGPLFHAVRDPLYFSFNEGGRVLTLTIMGRDNKPGNRRGQVPLFRLYLCGLVLMRKWGRWSLRRNF